MIKRLTLENFKSFNSVDLKLGPFTLLVGPNASGKSNIRDAFRLLHAIGRGYSLAECLNGRYAGGRLEWEGVRGGSEEVGRRGRLTRGRPTYGWRPKPWPRRGTDLDIELEDQAERAFRYRIGFDADERVRVLGEMLEDNRLARATFDTLTGRGATGGAINVRCFSPRPGPDPTLTVGNERPLLSALLDEGQVVTEVRESCERMRRLLLGIRFLDPDPSVMRDYARPEQAQLGDRGENLSAVLFDLCRKGRNRKQSKELLLEWIRELTPQDIEDIGFLETPTKEVLLSVTEPGGKQLSARSLSDGTLRYLAIASALLAADPGQVFFVEEIENGIHPTRIHLLVQMIEQMTSPAGPQVLATTHSPLVLAYLSEGSLPHALYCHPNTETAVSEIDSVANLPHIHEALEADSIDRLLATGWMEHAT